MFQWLNKLFKRNLKKERKFVITEGIGGTWHYHISFENSTTRSLCGEQTMITSLPMSMWGFVSAHIGEKYCSECKGIMDETNETRKREKISH